MSVKKLSSLIPLARSIILRSVFRYKHRARAKIGTSSTIVRRTRRSETHNSINTNPTLAIKARGSERQETRQPTSKPFIILSMLTASIIVCWTPVMTYWTIMVFVNIDLPDFFNFASNLYSLQALLDPILFALSLRQLTAKLQSWMRNMRFRCILAVRQTCLNS